ncbi:MAG: sulfite exporter TauE/SafE family protein [Rhizobiales bacterium]|nr:sulfite exporter TauE/SafE family protein [Hyphomicrobiales bacterium]
MTSLLSDPLFYAVCIPAVILVGLSKGGLGGAMGFVGVPLMALIMPPVQAAAILLPILLLMDVVSLWTWRGVYDGPLLRSFLPGAIVGLGLGWLMAALVTASMIRFMVGVIAAIFVGQWLVMIVRDKVIVPAKPNALLATLWSTVSGFTSFIAHVGGPPFQVYAMPLRLDPKVFTGTSVILFAVMNVIKVVPYFMLGELDRGNLLAAAVLLPVAPLATLAGAWGVRRMRPNFFYNFSYVTVGLIALKLLYDGAVQFLGG